MIGQKMQARTRIVAALAAGLIATPVLAKELSDKSVNVLMNYAWSIMPDKFTTPAGKVIEVDKTKMDKVVVPVDVARNVIQVARVTAQAQICQLLEESTANYRALMTLENSRKKWSDQQELYISQLHLFTVMWLSGKVKVIDKGEKDGDKEVVIAENKGGAEQTCTDAEKGKVKDEITAYLKQVTAQLPPQPAGAAATKNAEAQK